MKLFSLVNQIFTPNSVLKHWGKRRYNSSKLKTYDAHRRRKRRCQSEEKLQKINLEYDSIYAMNDTCRLKRTDFESRVKFPDQILLFESIKENDVNEIQRILAKHCETKSFNLNNIFYQGLTPLHLSVIEGHYSICELLLKNGANVNEQDIENWTCLHAAAAEGFTDITRLLIEYGADVTMKTIDNETPLDMVQEEDELTKKELLNNIQKNESVRNS
ncbi:hypothetical protein SNEBB_009777 [Seison nebaliae]|nr:hypothetical protein SNEBB_009777 [Seison nebaliae]